jgi:hypothetical protein
MPDDNIEFIQKTCQGCPGHTMTAAEIHNSLTEQIRTGGPDNLVVRLGAAGERRSLVFSPPGADATV